MFENFENNNRNPDFLDKNKGVESKFDENARMQEELMGFKRGIDKEKAISPITSADIARLELKHPSSRA